LSRRADTFWQLIVTWYSVSLFHVQTKPLTHLSLFISKLISIHNFPAGYNNEGLITISEDNVKSLGTVKKVSSSAIIKNNTNNGIIHTDSNSVISRDNEDDTSVASSNVFGKMTGKERTADEKRRGATRELEIVRQERNISRMEWAWHRANQDIRNGVPNDDEELLEMDRMFAEMDKRKDAQYAGKFGETKKWWLAEKEKEKVKSLTLKKHNIADSLLSSESGNDDENDALELDDNDKEKMDTNDADALTTVDKKGLDTVNIDEIDKSVDYKGEEYKTNTKCSKHGVSTKMQCQKKLDSDIICTNLICEKVVEKNDNQSSMNSTTTPILLLSQADESLPTMNCDEAILPKTNALKLDHLTHTKDTGVIVDNAVVDVYAGEKDDEKDALELDDDDKEEMDANDEDYVQNDDHCTEFKTSSKGKKKIPINDMNPKKKNRLHKQKRKQVPHSSSLKHDKNASLKRIRVGKSRQCHNSNVVDETTEDDNVTNTGSIDSGTYALKKSTGTIYQNESIYEFDMHTMNDNLFPLLIKHIYGVLDYDKPLILQSPNNSTEKWDIKDNITYMYNNVSTILYINMNTFLLLVFDLHIFNGSII